MKLGYHKEDWCHLCGKRKKYLVDVWYPNVEDYSNEIWIGKKDNQYIRICDNCIRDMNEIISFNIIESIKNQNPKMGIEK